MSLLIITGNASFPQENTWKFLGLKTERISSIVIDWSNPDVIYAGSESDFSAGTVGGIFKSTNGGADWDTLIRGVTVRDLDIHPQNHRIVYATLGINSLTEAGIIKTTDGGINWSKADNGIQISWEIGPYVLEIDPQHPDTIYSGTYGISGGGSPYKSINGGITWTNIAPESFYTWLPRLCGDSIYVNGPILRSGVTSLAIDPINTSIIYAGTPWSGFLFKSTDRGSNWIATCLPNYGGIVYDIKIDIESNLFCGTWKFGMFKSKDTGLSWEKMDTGLPDTLTIEKIQIYNSPTNKHIFIAGNWGDKGGIYQSINEFSWQKIGLDDERIKTINYSSGMLYCGSNGIYLIDIFTSVIENYLPINKGFILQDNFPNPFNPTTTINYEISFNSQVKLEIYNIQVEKIKTLVNKVQSAGKYSIIWDGQDEGHTTVSSGVYFCVLHTKNGTLTKKMIYIK